MQNANITTTEIKEAPNEVTNFISFYYAIFFISTMSVSFFLAKSFLIEKTIPQNTKLLIQYNKSILIGITVIVLSIIALCVLIFRSFDYKRKKYIPEKYVDARSNGISLLIWLAIMTFVCFCACLIK